MGEWLLDLVDMVKKSKPAERNDAIKLMGLQSSSLHTLLFAASELRKHFKGNSVKTCSIVNAKSGLCSEDCSFCAQSGHHRSNIATYPLMSCEEIISRAEKEEGHSGRFGIVTAGRGLSKNEVKTVTNTVKLFKEKKLRQIPCASLGMLEEDDFRALHQSGLRRYHHNLEASKRFYSSVCSTHSYEERLKTIRAARKSGLEVCVGGIFGMGESIEDRIDLLYEIKETAPDSVPINFLIPIPGTQLEGAGRISLWEAVKVTALARFIMPDTDIKIGAGRLEVFKDAQHLCFLAGANGMIVGDLLTIKGRKIEDDLAVINDMGFMISH
jgi:biotin synthase